MKLFDKTTKKMKWQQHGKLEPQLFGNGEALLKECLQKEKQLIRRGTLV